MIDLDKIKPKEKGKSDKYSWNLYKFLNKVFSDKDYREHYKKQISICWLNESIIDGEYLEFNPNKLYFTQLIILPSGIESGKILYFMSEILREGKSTPFYCSYNKDKLTDITDWFFKTYERDGRCIFDRSHNEWFLGDENRFTYVNNTRKCNWCNQWQQKEIYKKINIKKEEVWV